MICFSLLNVSAMIFKNHCITTSLINQNVVTSAVFSGIILMLLCSMKYCQILRAFKFGTINTMYKASHIYDGDL